MVRTAGTLSTALSSGGEPRRTCAHLGHQFVGPGTPAELAEHTDVGVVLDQMRGNAPVEAVRGNPTSSPPSIASTGRPPPATTLTRSPSTG